MQRTKGMWAMVVAGVLGLTLLPMGAAVYANCTENLVGKIFQCQGKLQDGATGSEAWAFVTGEGGSYSY
jgi:hypothetical protein